MTAIQLTTAETIAAQFGNDGMRFEDNQDRHLTDVCEEASVSREKGRHVYDDDDMLTEAYESISWSESIYDVVRYEFADGSAIVIAGDAWDIEGAEPFSWAGE
jgi:hypothetical protein